MEGADGAKEAQVLTHHGKKQIFCGCQLDGLPNEHDPPKDDAAGSKLFHRSKQEMLVQ